MPRLILFIFVVAALVAGAVWLANDPGSVSMTWRGWQIETSVGVLITAVIFAVLIILLIVRLLSFLGGRVQAFTLARRERRMKRGLASLGDGFAAVQAGQSHAARRLARQAGTLLNDNPAVLVLRKEAAALAGDTRELQSAAEALLARPETELAGLRTLAEKSFRDGDVAGALTHARRALERKDAPPWALRMVLDIEVAGERWPQALSALDEKLARDAYSPTELKRLKSRLLTLHAQATLAQGDAVGAGNAAKKAMDADDTNQAAVAAYAKAMTAQGKGRKAAGAVERAWAVKPSAELLAAYRNLVPGEAPLDWARRIDGLAKAAPDHAESRLAVATASLNAELWGQTRNRLAGLTGTDAAPDVRARAAALLADVERRERGDTDKAAEWLHLALEIQRGPLRTPRKPKSAAEILAQA
jgi:HemY protein